MNAKYLLILLAFALGACGGGGEAAAEGTEEPERPYW